MEARMRTRRFLMAGLPLCLAGGAALWASTPAVPVPTGKPKRIVSLNLCADQLVLALADRDQIAGLTRNADDTEMSGEAARARGLPRLHSSAEQMLAIGPDLVIGMPAPRVTATGVFKSQRYATLDLTAAETLDQIYDSIRRTAVAVGHPGRGEAMIARMAAELARIPKPGNGRVAAYYQRRGFMTGTGTLVDDLMRRVGLLNLAQRLDKSALAQVSIEEMVAAQPDFLIVESATDRVVDQGTEMLHHPALAGIPRISIPQAWTVCGSPAYVEAARGLAEQLGRRGQGPIRPR